jgi:hydrogenase maturation protein HypF
LVEIIATMCANIRSTLPVSAIALTGGVFGNALLAAETIARLDRDGFTVHRHRSVPPNDGGLSFGQLAVAASLATAS